MPRILALLIVVFFILLQQTLFADLGNSRDQLKKIQQRIEQAEKELNSKKKTEIKFSRELVLLKRSLRQIEKRISSLIKERQELKVRISAQENQIDDGKQELRKSARRLEKRLVALYKEGEIGPLKILFSADSPTELVQQFHYLTRIAKYDSDLVADYKQGILKQQELLSELKVLISKNEEVLENEKQQRKNAEEGRRLQAKLLKKIKAEKKQIKHELAQLEEKAKRLQTLISRLQKQPALPKEPGTVNFDKNKGKLQWPVDGTVLIGFGTQKDRSLGTYYESNGLEIEVPLNSPIRSVADGKVVFADWFKGYGNLLILSHVGGFHTLYAQADKIDKKLGTNVMAGEVVGKSGLGGRESIYFEIRQNGTPVNPLKWLQRR